MRIMKVITLKTKKIVFLFLIGCLFMIFIMIIARKFYCGKSHFVLGGKFLEEEFYDHEAIKTMERDEEFNEKYFRPSKEKVLNTKDFNDLVDNNFYKSPENINLNKDLFKNKEELIVNYFSVLREGANPSKNSKIGCGSLGTGLTAYKVAYNFLDKAYKEKLSYKEFEKSFEDMVHINLLKVEKLHREKGEKYFVELEVIEENKKNNPGFSYYYGFIDFYGEEGISNMEYYRENYLCAPYHGWNYDGKSVVEIKYGNWCDLIEGEPKVEIKGHKKKVYFSGKNGEEYFSEFIILTNGTDLKIGDYKKDNKGQWEYIYLNPEKCLDNLKSYKEF